MLPFGCVWYCFFFLNHVFLPSNQIFFSYDSVMNRNNSKTQTICSCLVSALHKPRIGAVLLGTNLCRFVCHVRASGLIVMCINLHRWWRWYLRPGKVSLQTGEERKVGKKVSSGSAQESKEGRENQIWGEKLGCCDSHYTNNILNSWLITILITNMTTAGILYLPLF